MFMLVIIIRIDLTRNLWVMGEGFTAVLSELLFMSPQNNIYKPSIALFTLKFNRFYLILVT